MGRTLAQLPHCHFMSEQLLDRVYGLDAHHDIRAVSGKKMPFHIFPKIVGGNELRKLSNFLYRGRGEIEDIDFPIIRHTCLLSF